MNRNIKIDLGERAYEIKILPGIIASCSEAFARYVCKKKCFVISDSNVFPLYGQQLITGLRQVGAIIAGHSVISAGEQSKTLATVEQIYHKTVEVKLDRASVIIALGGGVVGDIAGFVAATYMRGIDFIQIPTSLLAMVDSSVGGKTGVNLPEAKNIIGAFWQPKCVLMDPEALCTLPEREKKSALAEIIKYGIILDRSFFDELALNTEKINSLDIEFYAKIVAQSCFIKAKIVKEDEREKGLRAILNFGHTFGHAIETATEYKTYTHGEAVGIGVLMAGELACSLGMMQRSEQNKINSIYNELNMCAFAIGPDAKEIFDIMSKDKKAIDGKVHFVLPEKIGKVSIVTDVDKNLVIDAIEKYMNN